MPLCHYLPSWGEGNGTTQTDGGTYGYNLLKRYTLLIHISSQNIPKFNTPKTSE